ncbi:MAG: hypothetical protein ABI972_15190 [Acidobacteriota bacterium]
MSRLRLTQRWIPLPWGVFGVVLAFIFGGIGAYSWLYPEDGPTVRMAIPLYAVALYWVFVCLINRRTAVITPRSLWEIVWPLPVQLPRSTQRGDIRHCYLRNVTTFDDGVKLETYYTAGVETMGGRQIDVSSPHETEEEAAQIARHIAGVLNAESGGPMIKVVWVEQLPTRTEVIRKLLLALFWLAVCIAAIFAGAAWEQEYVRSTKGQV